LLLEDNGIARQYLIGGSSGAFLSMGDANNPFYYQYFASSSSGLSMLINGGGISVLVAKTAEIVINDGSADVNFRVEGDTDANLLFCDAGADDIYTGATGWTNHFSGVHNTGWVNTTDEIVFCKKIGKLVFVNIVISGTSNSDSVFIKLP